MTFSFMEDSGGTQSHNILLEEDESYFLEPREKLDPLEFWKSSGKRYTLLSQVAKKVLAVPASSAHAERLFSTAGALKRSRRSRLKSATVEKMLLYRDHRLMEIKRSGVMKTILGYSV